MVTHQKKNAAESPNTHQRLSTRALAKRSPIKFFNKIFPKVRDAHRERRQQCPKPFQYIRYIYILLLQIAPSQQQSHSKSYDEARLGWIGGGGFSKFVLHGSRILSSHMIRVKPKYVLREHIHRTRTRGDLCTALAWSSEFWQSALI